MSTKVSKLKEFIRNLIKQELKELEEASVTGNLDGGEGPPRTPYAFYGGRKKDKEKKKRIAQAGGYMKVKESVNERDNVAMAYKRTLFNKIELKKLKDAIEMFQKKIKKQGSVTNARDEEHLKNLIKVYKGMGGKGIREAVYKFRGYTNTQMDELDAMLARAGFKGTPDFNKMTWTTKDRNPKIAKIIKSKGGKR